MQLLFEHSAEGDTACLGVLRGRIERLRAAPGLPVPHMGWNTLAIERPDPLLEGLADANASTSCTAMRRPVGEATLAAVDYGRSLCVRSCGATISAACSSIPSAHRAPARACCAIFCRMPCF